jgi:hypothetical protein
MGSSPTNGARHLPNWIDAFVSHTDNLHSPKPFRIWSAITTIAAVLEQKVWIQTSTPVYPNLYVFIVGHPSTGKTRAIREARKLAAAMPDPFITPTSITFAALVDFLAESKRTIIRQPEGEIIYNAAFICADELGSFMHKYEKEMTDGLSSFYDQDAYGQRRRTGDLKVKLTSPLVNILAGSTPQNLMDFIPESAWGQGFTSRLIFAFSDERIIGDDFAKSAANDPTELIHDLKLINSLYGEFRVTESYRDAVNQWRALGEPPVPNHPRLIHYIGRRKMNIYKLSMIASINKSSGLILTEADFMQALEWLVAAETSMPDIFKAGAVNADGMAMDEIQHYVRVNDLGTGVSEQRIVHFARSHVPLHSILRIMEIMTGSGMLRLVRTEKRTGARFFSATPVAPTPPEVSPEVKSLLQ